MKQVEYYKNGNRTLRIKYEGIKKLLEKQDKEIERLNNIIDDKKERQDIAIRLLHKLFGTDDYEINYIIGIINGQRQIKFDDEILEKENK